MVAESTERPGEAMHTMKQTSPLTGLRRQSGLTLRDLQGITGINRGTAHRAIVDPANAKGAHLRRLRRAMTDEIRLRRSSDPDFLRRVREVAVPFLNCRAGIPMPAGKASPGARTP